MCRMELVGQSVPHRNARIPGQLLHDLLPEAAVLDAVVDAPQNTRRVGDALLVAHLRAGRIQISHLRAQVVRRHLK